MSVLQYLPAAAFLTLVAGILLLRLAFLAWGYPRRTELLFRWFTAPVKGKRQALSNGTVVGVILVLVEGMALVIVARAVAAGEYVIAAMFAAHIGAAFGLLLYLKRISGSP